MTQTWQEDFGGINKPIYFKVYPYIELKMLVEIELIFQLKHVIHESYVTKYDLR